MPGEDLEGADAADDVQTESESGGEETSSASTSGVDLPSETTEMTGETGETPDFVGCCYCNEIGAEVCVTGVAEQCGMLPVEYFDCGEVNGVLSCGLECDPPPAACCTCPDLTTPEYEFQCWAWVEGVEACVIAQANGLGEATHWCELDGDGYPTDCLDAC
jgi:hypothetical protein